MKILIYGTGGVGGYFGARLSQAGNHVTFVARGNHFEAIKKKGLQLKSVNGDYTVYPVNVVEKVDNLDSPDLILVATKTWQVKEAAIEISKIVSDKTIVLPLLNGVTNIGELETSISRQNIMGGFCKIFSKIEVAGIINHMSMEPIIGFGELDGFSTSRTEKLQQIFKHANIHNMCYEDVQHAIWSKFLFITSVSALGALTGATIGEMRSEKVTRNLILSIVEEVYAVGKAKGINFIENDKSKIIHFIDTVPYDSTSSLQRDMLGGSPSELDSQVGTIHRLGLELSIPTPVSTFVYSSLLLKERKARGLT